MAGPRIRAERVHVHGEGSDASGRMVNKPGSCSAVSGPRAGVCSIEKVHRPPEVVLDKLPAAGPAVDSRKDARNGRRIDDPVGVGSSSRSLAARKSAWKRRRRSVSVGPIRLASRADEIVEPEVLAVRPPCSRRCQCDAAAHKAADAGDQIHVNRSLFLPLLTSAMRCPTVSSSPTILTN